jgi:hypothetical protein
VRRLARRSALGRSCSFGTAAPRSVCRRDTSAPGILYGPVSFSISPETKNCARSAPPETCMPYCRRLPLASGDSASSLRTLNATSESARHAPEPTCVSTHWRGAWLCAGFVFVPQR